MYAWARRGLGLHSALSITLSSNVTFAIPLTQQRFGRAAARGLLAGRCRYVRWHYEGIWHGPPLVNSVTLGAAPRSSEPLQLRRKGAYLGRRVHVGPVLYEFGNHLHVPLFRGEMKSVQPILWDRKSKTFYGAQTEVQTHSTDSELARKHRR